MEDDPEPETVEEVEEVESLDCVCVLFLVWILGELGLVVFGSVEGEDLSRSPSRRVCTIFLSVVQTVWARMVTR
mgnify:CR=1 FL=1